jgi:putative DNA primase/helicase
MSAGTFTPDPSWPSIVELAIELWGEPTERRRDEVRFGSRGARRVRPSKNLWKDEESGEGGGYVQIWEKARHGVRLPPRTDTKGNGKHTGVPPWEDIGPTYDYPGTDADPRLIQVVRTKSGKPRFRQRQPLGDGKWKWSVGDIADHNRRLYRLADLRAAPKNERTWVCSGEKDANRLHNAGLVAVTNIGGEGKWRSEYAEEFRDRHCIVLQDNDATGARHVADVARALHGVAASVRMLLLPNLPPKGDVSDFLDAGNTLNELDRLADEAPEYVPPQSEAGPDPELVLPIAFSENALAHQFTALHAAALIFCHDWNKWLRWEGGQWHEDHTVSVYDAVRVICAQAGKLAIATEKTGKKIAAAINKAACVSGIERLARHDRRHAHHTDDFDADPWLLNSPDITATMKGRK